MPAAPCPSPAPSPLVSVALCTCNGEAYIEAQLASVLAQTYRDVEVVVVDDASTDRTAEIVEDAARRDDRIRVHRNPRRLGVNANFARAFALCRGDFIAPCDQDDIWSARKLQRLLAAIGEADLAYCNSAIVDAEGRPTGATLGGGRRMVKGRGHAALAFDNTVSGHAMVFRNTLLAEAAPFPDGVWYDWWLAFAALQRGGIIYVDEVMVEFRRHGGTQTRIGHATAGTRLSRRQRRAREARQWLTSCAALLQAVSARPWPGRELATSLSTALMEARRERRTGPVFWAVLRHRKTLHGDAGPSLVPAIRLAARILRRLQRASADERDSQL